MAKSKDNAAVVRRPTEHGKNRTNKQQLPVRHQQPPRLRLLCDLEKRAFSIRVLLFVVKRNDQSESLDGVQTLVAANLSLICNPPLA